MYYFYIVCVVFGLLISSSENIGLTNLFGVLAAFVGVVGLNRMEGKRNGK